MSNRLGGFQGTAYLGTNANQPSNVTFHKDNPTQYDNQNYSLGDQWVNTVDKVIWSLVSLAGDATSKGQLATWIQTGGSASTTTYVTDSGSATESGGMIDIFGGPNINTSGSAATVEVSLNQNLVSLGSVEMEDLIVNNSATLGFLGEGILGTNSSGLIAVTDGDDGQILIASTAGTPQWANLTAGANITITNGPNSIEIEASGSGDVGTIDGDVGSATGTVLTLTGGSTGLIFTGAVSTLTMSGTVEVDNGGTGATTLTGVLIGHGASPITGNTVTNHNMIIGGASNALTSLAPSATVGIPLVSQGASADPAFTTAVVAGGGTGAITLTSNGILIGHGTSPVTALTAGTNGQIPIGRTGNSPVMANITAGSGVSITNGSGSITISSSSGSGAGLVLLETQDVSGLSEVIFNSGIDPLYDSYLLIGSDITTDSVTTSGPLILQFSTDGGSTFISTSTYATSVQTNDKTAATAGRSGGVASGFGICQSGIISGFLSINYFNINISGINSSINTRMNGTYDSYYISSSPSNWFDYYTYGNFFGASLPIDAFKISASGGATTMLTGKISLYGYVL